MDFHVGEHWTYGFFGTTVHLDTLFTMWFTMAIIIVLSFVATHDLKMVPGKLQAFFENIVTIFVGLTKDLGKNARRHTVILMSLFMFILLANLMGQLPWRLLHLPHGEFASPTNDINVTAALAVVVVFYYIIQGIIEKGPAYFKHYFHPVPFMAPFNFLEDFIKPLTLALRLFANILAGEILIMVLGGVALSLLTPQMVEKLMSHVFNGILPTMPVYDLSLFLGSLAPLPIMFFELFVAFIQALVFTLLTSAYIQMAVQESD
jgi:F-type H+-transporting ATPase subunit a